MSHFNTLNWDKAVIFGENFRMRSFPKGKSISMLFEPSSKKVDFCCYFFVCLQKEFSEWQKKTVNVWMGIFLLFKHVFDYAYIYLLVFHWKSPTFAYIQHWAHFFKLRTLEMSRRLHGRHKKWSENAKIVSVCESLERCLSWNYDEENKFPLRKYCS